MVIVSEETKPEFGSLQIAIRQILSEHAVDSYEAEARLADVGLREPTFATAAISFISEFPRPALNADDEYVAAYIIAHTFQRRQGNPDICAELDEKASLIANGVKTYPILRHFQAMTKVMLGKSEAYEALDLARKVALDYPTHSGVQHSLASTYVRLSEFQVLSTADLEDALLTARKAITLLPSKARFHYTKARIEKLFHKFEFALESLSTAIAREDSSAVDYQLRLAEYKIEIASVSVERRIYEQQIELNQRVHELSKDLAAAQNSLESAQSRQVETLAIFTAILGLISGATQMVFKLKLWESVVLMVVMGVVLVGSIFVAHLMIDERTKKRKRS